MAQTATVEAPKTIPVDHLCRGCGMVFKSVRALGGHLGGNPSCKAQHDRVRAGAAVARNRVAGVAVGLGSRRTLEQLSNSESNSATTEQLLGVGCRAVGGVPPVAPVAPSFDGGSGVGTVAFDYIQTLLTQQGRLIGDLQHQVSGLAGLPSVVTGVQNRLGVLETAAPRMTMPGQPAPTTSLVQGGGLAGWWTAQPTIVKVAVVVGAVAVLVLILKTPEARTKLAAGAASTIGSKGMAKLLG